MIYLLMIKLYARLSVSPAANV